MSYWQIIVGGIVAITIVLFAAAKLGDWLGQKLCDYLDRKERK